jgi:hypothetical protein
MAAILFFTSAVQREHQQLLGELVGRHVEESLLDVAARLSWKRSRRPSSTIGFNECAQTATNR